MFAFNEPYRGGTHLPDMTFISPIFWDGRLIAFTATKGHWSDVGGPTPGSMNALALDIYAEGLVIPPLKVVSRRRGPPRRPQPDQWPTSASRSTPPAT